MEVEKKINYGLILTVIITVTGWGVTFGICKNQIEQNAKDIARIEKLHAADIEKITTKQDGTDALLQSINTNLVELNTKVSLLLNGKIQRADR